MTVLLKICASTHSQTVFGLRVEQGAESLLVFEQKFYQTKQLIIMSMLLVEESGTPVTVSLLMVAKCDTPVATSTLVVAECVTPVTSSILAVSSQWYT